MLVDQNLALLHVGSDCCHFVVNSCGLRPSSQRSKSVDFSMYVVNLARICLQNLFLFVTNFRLDFAAPFLDNLSHLSVHFTDNDVVTG